MSEEKLTLDDQKTQSPDAEILRIKLEYQLKIKEYEDNKRGAFNKAFAKFQQAVKAPKKNGHVSFKTSKGYGTNYDYVLLDDLTKAINDGLKDTGISWNQDAVTKKDGRETLITVSTNIKYENGYEFTSSPISMFTSKTDPQSIASVITYAKRYSLSAAFGVNSDEDNDGVEKATTNSNKNYNNHNSYSNNRSNYQQPKQQPKQPARPTQPAPQAKNKYVNVNTRAIAKVASMKGILTEQYMNEIRKIVPFKTLADLSEQDAETLYKSVKSEGQKLAAEQLEGAK